MLVISGAFALLLSVAFVVLIVAIQAQRTAERAALRSQQAVTAGQVLEKSLLNLDEGVRGFVASDRDSALAPYDAALRAYPSQLAALRRLERDSPATLAIVERISEQMRDFVTLWAQPMIAIARERIVVARSVVGNVTDRERIEGIRRQFERLLAAEQATATQRRVSAESQSQLAIWLGVGGVALMLALTVGLALYLRRSVVAPVRRVARSSEAVAAGDLTIRVPGDREDEIGQLTRGFNEMTASLEAGRARLDRRTAELERSNRDLDDFASVASHDMQGPLTTISMFSSALEERMAERGDRDTELAGHIRAAASHLRGLVRDLLAYAKLERRPMHPRPVDLGAVLRQALDNLAGPIETAGAEIVTGPMPMVTGDRTRLCQLLQNLLGNAVKFSDAEHPVVRVHAGREGEHAHLTVRDNGIGFDQGEAAHIFRPFHRLHSSDDYEGSGIGLAICERIVSQHGGRIWAEGEERAGATFHVDLPLADTGDASDGPGAVDGDGAAARTQVAAEPSR